MNFPLYSLPRVLRESKFGSVLCRPEYKAQLYLAPHCSPTENILMVFVQETFYASCSFHTISSKN